MGTLSAYECGNIDEQGLGFRSVWALFANKCGNIYEQGRSIYEQGQQNIRTGANHRGSFMCQSCRERPQTWTERRAVSFTWMETNPFLHTNIFVMNMSVDK